MLLESDILLKSGAEPAFGNIVIALARSSRETDITGWYKQGSTLGIIFTEIGSEVDGQRVAYGLLAKVTKALSSSLSITQINQINLSFHVFPEKWDQNAADGPADPALYPDQAPKTGCERVALAAKRLMDIAGSLVLLAGLSPLLLAIAAAIKLTSKGPVLYCQERMGHRGKRFTFLKFRSMALGNDEGIHKDYVRQLIGTNDAGAEHCNAAVYKLTNDPRVTPVGRLLRRTSLDELPQLFHVLSGKMSLVGPRPPIPYEVACYEVWHKARLVVAKPGITGLWQIRGRSRVKFDDMVRMDLEYSRSWSLWLDIKIVLQTPSAIVSGEGAY